VNHSIGSTWYVSSAKRWNKVVGGISTKYNRSKTFW
jgi:hypothetical protein